MYVDDIDSLYFKLCPVCSTVSKHVTYRSSNDANDVIEMEARFDKKKPIGCWVFFYIQISMGFRIMQIGSGRCDPFGWWILYVSVGVVLMGQGLEKLECEISFIRFFVKEFEYFYKK